VEIVEEVSESGSIPLLRHPEWQDRFPWLVQGTTARGEPDEPLDFGLFGEAAVGEATARWRLLRQSTGAATVVHSRQVHRAEVATWREPLPQGHLLVEGYDAHVTAVPGILLTISVADCIPIFLVAEDPRVVALVHAGWRGIVAGVLEAALDSVEAVAGTRAEELWLHCGPSICGTCYEVGPEVHAAIHPGRPIPELHEPVDLVAAIAERAGNVGIDAERMTSSAHCTLCGPGSFFSHRAGSRARQLGVVGIRG
jgi:polyphenol oxidase